MSSRVRYVLEQGGRVVAQGPEAISILKRGFKERIGTDADSYIKQYWATFRTWSRAQLVEWFAQTGGGYTVRMYKEKRGVRGPRSQYWAHLRRAQRQQQQPQLLNPHYGAFWEAVGAETGRWAIDTVPTNAPTR